MPTLWAADNHAAPLHLLLHNAAVVCDQLRTAWCWWLSCLGQYWVPDGHIPMRVYRRGSKAVCLQCHTRCCTQALQSASEIACTLASDVSATEECLLSMMFSKTNILLYSGAQSTLRVTCHGNAARWVLSSPNKSCQRYCTSRGSASQGLDTRQQDVLRLPGRSSCPALDAILVQQNLAAMGYGSPLPRRECVWSTDSSPARH